MRLNKFSLPFVLLLLGGVFYFSYSFTFESVTTKLLNQQVEKAKNQANLISQLLEVRLERGTLDSIVVADLQKSIEGVSTDNSFICMFDNTGKEICHPNKNRVGKIISERNSVIHFGTNFETENNFKKAIQLEQPTGGIRQIGSRVEIVYLSPVKNSDWIVASHSNVENFRSILNDLQEKLLFIYTIIWLVSSLLIFFFIDLINKKNILKIIENNNKTSETYFNELKLSQQSLNRNKQNGDNNRLLVNKGSKLSPVFINEIAYVFIQNRITYVYEYNGEKSTINLTLDELFSFFNKSDFYRASRKVILSAKSIDKIEKYGNNQLKVTVKPIAPIDIVISKAKLSEFKKWVGNN